MPSDEPTGGRLVRATFGRVAPEPDPAYVAELARELSEHYGRDGLIELYGPIDEMFNELKRRLESIPTADQQATARQRKEKR